jgi:PhoPQ-activated pathogenicity-related protein
MVRSHITPFVLNSEFRVQRVFIGRAARSATLAATMKALSMFNFQDRHVVSLRGAIAALCLLLPTAASRAATTTDTQTALDRYVAKPDPAYSYKLVNTLKAEGVTGYIIEMTSQSWLTTNEVDRPLWKHWLTIVKPDKVDTSTGFLFISGGANDNPAPKGTDGNLIRMAVATKSVVTELRMVPNQPLTFAGETKKRSEDSLIAYTWDKFLRTGDEKWPARLPMTKSAVRAMDTVTSFCAGDTAGKIKVDGFVVAGGSKRGWTTWTTAAVDKRVVAIIPMVIDMLNVEPSFLHHYAAYGFWAPAVGDYTAMRIMDWNGTPEYHALMKIEEPYQYRSRLTMPKFIINASGDQFFLPDSSQFYFNDLTGVKYLRYVPNADHSLKGSDVWETVLACYQSVLTHAKLPRFSWTVEKDGALRVKSEDAPKEVKLWKTTNPTARDFRLMTIGPAWKSEAVNDEGGGYLARVAKPEQGWTAFFLELTYPSGGPTPFKFTTEVRVVPDVTNFKFTPGPVR